MVSNLIAPVIFAHRGASAHAPENTLSAFRLARDQGALALELDVQLTSDKVVVVFHDSIVDRTTNGSGKIIDLPYSYLKTLNAGQAYGTAFQNEKICTLEEVFSELPDFPLINIELKNFASPWDDLPTRVSEIITRHNYAERVLISSFNPIALASLHRTSPDLPLGRLFHTSLPLAARRLIPGGLRQYYSVHVSAAILTSRLVDDLHARGKKVFTYTLNHPEDMLRALRLGADGFFTDDPGLAIRTLAKLPAD